MVANATASNRRSMPLESWNTLFQYLSVFAVVVALVSAIGVLLTGRRVTERQEVRIAEATSRSDEARRDASYAQFQQTVLIAVEDVERSLIRYAEEQLEQRTLSQAVTAGQRTVELASVLYDKGLVDFLTVLDAERTLRDVEDQLVLSETAVTLNVIALYKALGGGWNAHDLDV